MAVFRSLYTSERLFTVCGAVLEHNNAHHDMAYATQSHQDEEISQGSAIQFAVSLVTPRGPFRHIAMT